MAGAVAVAVAAAAAADAASVSAAAFSEARLSQPSWRGHADANTHTVRRTARRDGSPAVRSPLQRWTRSLPVAASRRVPLASPKTSFDTWPRAACLSRAHAEELVRAAAGRLCRTCSAVYCSDDSSSAICCVSSLRRFCASSTERQPATAGGSAHTSAPHALGAAWARELWRLRARARARAGSGWRPSGGQHRALPALPRGSSISSTSASSAATCMGKRICQHARCWIHLSHACVVCVRALSA